MRTRNELVWLVMLCLLPTGLQPAPARAQFPPAPRPFFQDRGVAFSAADFQRALAQLKAEREALDADWKSLTKRLSTPRSVNNEIDLDKLHEQLKQTLVRLQKDRLSSPKTAPQAVTPPSIPASAEMKKKPEEDSRPSVPSSDQPVDALQLAQTLYRAERYDEALTVFQSVDLKNKRADERMPIVYLTAKCLQLVGKSDEAVTLLREVANSKGDERVAGYAQWEIENLRWHREIQARLEEIRQRRLATEKH